MDDTSRSLQARVVAILISALHIKLENSGNITILQSIFPGIMFQCHLVYTGRMSSTFTIRDIVNENATASVSDYGAHVLSWAPVGEQPVVWRPRRFTLRKALPSVAAFPLFSLGSIPVLKAAMWLRRHLSMVLPATVSGIMTRKGPPELVCATRWIRVRSTQTYFPSLFLARILNFMPFTPLKSAVS